MEGCRLITAPVHPPSTLPIPQPEMRSVRYLISLKTGISSMTDWQDRAVVFSIPAPRFIPFHLGVPPYRLIYYPEGSLGTPVAFDVGAGYISAYTSYPDACYRWLSTLAQHPELLLAMPARHS